MSNKTIGSPTVWSYWSRIKATPRNSCEVSSLLIGKNSLKFIVTGKSKSEGQCSFQTQCELSPIVIYSLIVSFPLPFANKAPGIGFQVRGLGSSGS